MPSIAGSTGQAFQHQFVTAGDTTLHVVETLTPGPPLLLIHGVGMDWRVWQAVSRRLRACFHLYLVDLRGHGQSYKPAAGYTLGHYAADIEDLVEALGLRDVSVVGSSLGGMVAATIEAPVDVVSHRVLVDPPLTGGPIRDERMFRDILRLKHEPVPALADYLAAKNPGTGRYLLTAMSEMWHEAADGVIGDMLARPHDYYNIRRAMLANESPTLLLQADPHLGGVLQDDEAQRALALLARGRLERFEGAGHAIHAYQPARFTDVIRSFTTS